MKNFDFARLLSLYEERSTMDLLPTIFAGIEIVAILTVILLIFISVKTKKDISNKIFVPFIILIITSMAFVIVPSEIKHKEYDKKIKEEYSKLKTTEDRIKTIQVHDITLARKLNVDKPKEFCPTIEKNEDCYIVEFVSDSNIKQVFLPAKDDLFTNVKNGNLVLQVYDFSEKELKFFFKEFQYHMLLKLDVDINHFAYAKSFDSKE